MSEGQEAQALELRLASGLTLRGLRWVPEGQAKARVLALHGWLDNAASFEGLGPLLAKAGYEVAAVELPGHGWSDHKAGGRYHFIEWPVDASLALDALGWERAVLLGHSMGAGVAALLAGLEPKRVEHLIMLDGLGPFATEPEDAVQMVRQALDELRAPVRSAPFYPDLDTLASKRAQAFGATMSPQSALRLVRRGSAHSAAGWQQTHDPCLRRASLLRLTEGHVKALFEAVSCPVLIVRAKQGWPAPEDLFKARVGYLRGTMIEAEGGHHTHLDSPELLINDVLAFLERT